MKFLNLLFLIIFAFVSNAGFAATIGEDQVVIGKPGSTGNKQIKLGSKIIRDNQTSGKLEYSNDGSIFQAIGSGSGSGGAGAFSIAVNPGFEDGIASGWTATASTLSATTTANALLGSISASFDPSLQNDYLRSGYLNVPKGLRGAACEARFLYTGADRNIYAKVETESGVVLGSYINSFDGLNGIPAHPIAEYESVYFKCPTESDVTALSTNGNIRLVLYQGTTTNAASGVFDDVHLGALIGLVETTTPDDFSARVSGSGTVTEENVDWLGTASVSDTSLFTVSVNPGIFNNDPSCVASLSTADSVSNLTVRLINTTKTSIQARTLDGTTKVANSFTIKCSKVGADAKQAVQVYKSIPKVSSNANTIPVKVTTGTGGTNPAILSDTLSIVTSFTRSSVGTYVLNYTAGGFTVPPIVVCSSEEGYVESDITTATTATLITRNTSGTAFDSNLNLSCVINKQIPDFKMPIVQPIVIGQVTSSAAESGLTNVRVESCKVNNSGTATMDTNSGLCSSWVSFVNRGGLGEISVNPLAGIFSATPVCHVTPLSLDITNCYIRDTVSTTNMVVECEASNSGSNTDKPFMITCMGKR